MPAVGLNLRLARTKTDAADDADPRTTPPVAADIFVLRPVTDTGAITKGFYAKMHCDAGDTITLEVYVRNEAAADAVETWALAGTIPLLEPDVLILQDDIGDGAIFFRCTTLTSGAEPIEIWAEELA